MKRTILLFLSALVASGAFPLSLDDVLPGLSREDRRILEEKKELVRYSEALPEFRYLPVSRLSEKIRRDFTGYEPNVCDEVLFLMPLPTEEGDKTLYLYNKLRAISTLSGIRYHSNRHKEMRVLFSDVYAIDTLRSKKKVPDKIVQTIPEEDRFPVHIEDVNFGSGYYEASYLASGEEIAFGLKNLTSLKYVFPIIGAEKVRFRLLVIPLEKELLMYGIVAAEAGSFVKSMIHLPSSLYTRIRALRDWFSGQVY